MISENPLERPCTREALYELINIENYIKNTSKINEKIININNAQKNTFFSENIG